MSSIVNCAGTPPMFFKEWTYRPTDQLPNLYKGELDVSAVVAVQAPSQQNGYTQIYVIERELGDYEFVGAHAAEWFARPENKTAFLELCPSGALVFHEKYRDRHRFPMSVFLYVREGLVRVGSGWRDNGVAVFDVRYHFAVRRQPNT